MKVTIIIDSKCNEPVCEIHTANVSEEIQKFVDAVNSECVTFSTDKDKNLFMISAWKDETVTLLKPANIMRIYSCVKKIFAETENETYELKYRLYEIENLISEHSLNQFIRISNTDIVNFDFVKNLDMSLSGNICVNFINKTRTFVSRRYMKKVREKLQIR